MIQRSHSYIQVVSIPAEDEVFGLLRGVVDPELGADIVTLGMAKGVEIDEGGVATITVALTTAGCPLRAQIQRDVKTRVASLPGITKVAIRWTELTQEEKATTMATARKRIAEQPPDTAVPNTTRVLMIASGKGGVGKSSVTVNLAAALAAQGLAVGIIDADIWGFSVPRMLGVSGRLEGGTGGKMQPNSLNVGTGRIDVVSMGFLVDAEETALMWRGLILQRAVQHFLEDVDWAPDLAYLLIDMPPGTGDVQMGLAKLLPRAEMIVVTTPSRSAQKVAIRSVNMARKNFLRVAGVVENMAAYVAPDGSSHEIFGSGGGRELADDAGVSLLAQIPIESAVAAGGDTGHPIALGDGPAAEAFRALAQLIVSDIAPPTDLAGCSVRMLSAMDAALAAADAG